ncbi:MAG: oligopeptide/dipeptide ABC transporter ATP-binding protein [Candidatus Thorarchaeota archaeon]|jgi:peptide/nickel transport system ATP-binding protein
MTTSDQSPLIVEAIDLKKWFTLRKGLGGSIGFGGEEVYVRAVDGVDIDIRDGEIFGIVGESGCGKTTLGKLLIRLLEPTDGVLKFMGEEITHHSMKKMRPLRREMQIIYQDPFSSLPVRFKASAILAEPFKIHKMISGKEEAIEKASELLEKVGLVPVEVFLEKHPNALSGGQRQRLSIARSIALKPKFIVADEPVSMLDLSVRAEILNLIKALKEEYGLTVLLITHDLASAQFMCNRIGIMYVGKMVEKGPGKEILTYPFHPYTMLLKAALPTLDPRTKHHHDDLPTEGEVANPIAIPKGCRFHPRCIYAKDICNEEEPELIAADGREVACHALGDWLNPEGYKQ